MTCIASPAHAGGTHASLCTGVTFWASGRTTPLTLTLSACTTGGIQPCTSGRAAWTAGDGSWKWGCEAVRPMVPVLYCRPIHVFSPGGSATAAFSTSAAPCHGADPETERSVAPGALSPTPPDASTWRWPRTRSASAADTGAPGAQSMRYPNTHLGSNGHAAWQGLVQRVNRCRCSAKTF